MSQKSSHGGLFERDSDFTVLHWPTESSDLMEHMWDVVELEIWIVAVLMRNLEQLHDAFMQYEPRSEEATECSHEFQAPHNFLQLNSISHLILGWCNVYTHWPLWQ